MLKESLGLDWKELFDVICANCQKPLFHKTYNTFKEIKVQSCKIKGDEIKNLDEFALKMET